MNEYKLDNGWTVFDKNNGCFYLHVIPISNSLFSKEMYIEIPSEIYMEVKNGETKVLELFKKYKLYDIIFQWDNDESNTQQIHRQNTNVSYFGKDYLLTIEGNKYFIEYELSRQGGRHRKFEITKEIYENSKNLNISVSELIKQNQLSSFDVPDNDIRD